MKIILEFKWNIIVFFPPGALADDVAKIMTVTI